MISSGLSDARGWTAVAMVGLTAEGALSMGCIYRVLFTLLECLVYSLLMLRFPCAYILICAEDKSPSPVESALAD